MPILDVIKYEGDNRTFVWKHPAQDFNTNSQLIVHESQEAHLFLGGQALDVFGPGRHTLTTQNIPLLTSIANLATGGVTPFHAEVYFVNLTEQMGISWGTSTKVQYMDPTYGFPLSIGASGDMALAVSNGRKLLLKLVGTEVILSQDRLIGYFKSFLQARVKSALAQAMCVEGMSIFTAATQLVTLSEDMRSRLIPDFAEYGLELTQFMVSNLVRPEGDPIYQKFRDLHFRMYADVADARIRQQVEIIDEQTEAQRTVIAAQAAAQKRSTEGYTYQEERSFDVAERVASNEPVGEFSNLGIGLGTMAGVGASVGGMVTGALNNATQTSPSDIDTSSSIPYQSTVASNSNGLQKFCPQCGHAFAETDKFGPECGARRQ